MDPVHLAVSRFLLDADVRRDAAVLAAVSGGADSMALLRALVAVGQRTAVAHVHHGLRGADADDDLSFVAHKSRALGLPFHVAHVDASERDGRSPEARARALRYAALESIRVREGHAHVATAHTLDDQAETVLLRAIRGTGVEGLASIRPVSEDGVLLRPLLAVARAAVRASVADSPEAFREDATNADVGIPRNRLRAEVIPVLEEVHPGATRRLAALADRAREVRAPLRAEVERRLEAAIEDAGGLRIERGVLADAPSDLLGPLLAGLLRRAGAGERVTSDHLSRLAEFVSRAKNGQALSLPLGLALVCTREHFRLGRALSRSEGGPDGETVAGRGSKHLPADAR